MKEFEINKRNKVVRVPKRGFYDKETVYEILDAGFLCHIAFILEGQTYVIPTAYGRKDDTLYIHGSTKSRLLLALQAGASFCLSVTHVDALVLARSLFHHSMNYRSAAVYGSVRLAEGQEKMDGLYIVTENILKGRWDEAREPNEKEMKATTVLAIDIEQASAKIRTGPAKDEKADYELPIWAGLLPIETTFGEVIPDDRNLEGLKLPKSVNGKH